MKWALGVMGVLIVACSGAEKPECRVFGVSPEFTAGEQAAIGRAASRWNEFTGRTVLTVSYTDAPEACRIEKVDGALSDNGMQVNGTFYWHGRDGTMRLATAQGCGDITDAECFEESAMHEFGHALGLHHVEPEKGIMSPGVVVKDFGAVDRVECERVGVCEK